MNITLGHTFEVDATVKFAFQDETAEGYRPHMLKDGTTTWFYDIPGQANTLLLGLGEEDDFCLESLRRAAGNAGRAIVQEKFAKIEVDFESLQGFCDSTGDILVAWVEGFLMGVYRFDDYKSEKEPLPIEAMQILSIPVGDFEEGVRRGKIRAEAVALARDLANEPANRLDPKKFARRVESRFHCRKVDIEVYEGKLLAELKFEGLMAVGRGSQNPPAMVKMTYTSDPNLPLVALVGKGLTFDMGGMNVKVSRDVSDMRFDMAGAAAVVGAMDIISKMGIRANVVAIVPLAENLPGGKAFLPSHVIEYPDGPSVQVGNTDAEGRLVLADALLLAQRLGAQEVVDIATLTGSIVSALGANIAGVFGEDTLVDRLKTAAEDCGDALWPMPLIDEYEDTLKSDYADISNISSSPHAGSITAALFLRRFIKDTPWAHIDMAGTMESKKSKGYHTPGATGFGVRLLADYVEKKFL